MLTLGVSPFSLTRIMAEDPETVDDLEFPPSPIIAHSSWQWKVKAVGNDLAHNT